MVGFLKANNYLIFIYFFCWISIVFVDTIIIFQEFSNLKYKFIFFQIHLFWLIIIPAKPNAFWSGISLRLVSIVVLVDGGGSGGGCFHCNLSKFNVYNNLSKFVTCCYRLSAILTLLSTNERQFNGYNDQPRRALSLSFVLCDPHTTKADHRLFIVN